MRISTPAPVAALALALVLTASLSGCTPSDGSSTPSPSASVSESPTPSPTPTESDSPEPEPASGLSASDRESLRDAVTSGNTAAIEGYLSTPVNYVLAASECCGLISPADAVANLSYLENATPSWNFDLPAATIDGWRASLYYGYLFPPDLVVGQSADGMIIAFGIVDDEVTTIFVGYEDVIFG